MGTVDSIPRRPMCVRRAAVALTLVVVALLVLIPAVELVADGVWSGSHHPGHLHSSAAVPGQAPALPEPPLVMHGSDADRAGRQAAEAPAVFVPPRA